ncbi:hypothetical protein [Phaeovulum sp. W22_SRMD_FR3]|uniref:hypothetical protein n=1 Tax=Phaeovulum sp. W22_SRMD_FR3 TaxID=3240274 RepID=UPI003F9DADD9
MQDPDRSARFLNLRTPPERPSLWPTVLLVALICLGGLLFARAALATAVSLRITLEAGAPRY